MRISDILDGAFKLFKGNARALILVTSVFMVPVQVAAAFIQRNLFGGEGVLEIFNDPSAAQAELESGNGELAAWGVFGLATVLVVPFVAGAASRIVAGSYLGEDIDAGEALLAVGRRWWAFVVAWVLVHLAEAVGLVLCVLPGVALMALFVPVAPIIAVEGLGPVKAMKRSVRLVRRRFFPVLGIALLSGLLASAVGQALGFIPQTIALLIGLKWGWILVAAGSILTAIITTPFVAIVATLVYFDARIRQEGLDLEIMAADLGGPAGGRPGPWGSSPAT